MERSGPPLVTTAPQSSDLSAARQIISGYVRHRHNDWSENWIRKALEPMAKYEYPGWVEDLVLLCRSHHFSIDQLKASSFDPRRVGNPGTVLHLRYCACLLRVADVLDFDPERTPPILFAHRAIEGTSAIFWHKDHELAFEHAGSSLSIDARPRDAITDHALRLTVDDVNAELLGSRRLADETQFHRMSGRESDLPHRWILETSVRARIVPRDGTYEYIDGTFRPDASKLLELVGGVELYGSPFAAVRELLQNAFDAVRDQIARQRLRQDDPGSLEVGELIARTHSVSLTLKQEDDGSLRLICRDTGSGMSREIIKSRFLVGGKRANHEMRALERTCQERGFGTGKTSRFGIGVLSYFLIGSNMEIHTRRSIEADDPDGIGWSFSTTGLDDFGELKEAPGAQVGTEVVLTIHPELVDGDPEQFAEKLRVYVNETVRRVPCRFSFSASSLSSAELKSDLGWVDSDSMGDKIADSLIRDQRDAPVPSELLSAEDRKTRERKFEYRQRLRDEAFKTLRIDVHEGPLPDRLGQWRAHFVHFDLEGHASSAFFRLRPRKEGPPEVADLGMGHGLLPTGSVVMNWNGMALEMGAGSELVRRLGDHQNAVVEIDWCSDAAGRLAVSRSTFEPSEAALEALGAVDDALREIRVNFVGITRQSPFYLVNARVLGVLTDAAGEQRWLGNRPDEARLLCALRPPIIECPIPRLNELSVAFWRGQEARELERVTLSNGESSRRELSWYGYDIEPTYVGAVNSRRGMGPAVVWDDVEPRGGAPKSRPGFTASFPPEWASIAGILGETGVWRGQLTVWNAHHPLVRACDGESWRWAQARLRGSRDPLACRSELLSSAGRAAAWILACLLNGDRWAWDGVAERDKTFLTELWKSIDGMLQFDEVSLWNHQYNPVLNVLTQSNSLRFDHRNEPDEIPARVVAPSADWWISTRPTNQA